VLFREIAIVKERSIDDLLHELGEWVDEDGDMNNAIDEARENVAADVCVVIHRFLYIPDAIIMIHTFIMKQYEIIVLISGQQQQQQR